MSSPTSNQKGANPGKLKEKAENNGLKYVMPFLSSFSSDPRGCLVPTSALNQLEKNGWGFFAVDHYKMTMEEPEMFGIPDPDTLIKMPWKPNENVGMVLCDMYQRGKICPQCPRTKLRELQQQARDLGFVMKTGIEPEFILLKKDKHELAEGEIDADLRVYHEPHNLLDKMDFVTDVLDTMENLGWGPYQGEHEAVSGQYEMNFGFCDALAMADRHTYMKFFIKEIAKKHGCRATFMPAPFPGRVMGSGLHLNISLWSTDNDENLFPGSSPESGLSEIGEHFTAGILKHAQALTAILCPNINSYKRLNATTLSSDVCATWGRESRYPAIRIPNNQRIEVRWADGSCNPYLFQASVLAAGLDGVINKLPLKVEDRVESDMTGQTAPPHLNRLPTTLEAAYKYLEQDESLRKYLGDDIVEGFVHIKKKAWNEFIRVITEWEVGLADEY